MGLGVGVGDCGAEVLGWLSSHLGALTLTDRGTATAPSPPDSTWPGGPGLKWKPHFKLWVTTCDFDLVTHWPEETPHF